MEATCGAGAAVIDGSVMFRLYFRAQKKTPGHAMGDTRVSRHTLARVHDAPRL